MLQVSTARIAATIVAILLEVALPIVLAAIIRRRLGVGWRYFGYGALIFFLFQLISRVPAVQVIQALIAPQLQASRALLLAWVVILAVSAGLFEEIGRYVGYRWLMRHEEKTWRKAVMYGLGHGGLESMLLVAGLLLLSLINLLVLPSAIGTLPPEQRTLAERQLAALAALPDWAPLLSVWERLWGLPVHVALSVMVLQVFRRGSVVWLWLAVVAHTLVNLVAIGLVQVLGPNQINTMLVVEVIIAAFGLAALWIIWQLRDPPEEVAVAVGRAAPGPPPLAAEERLPE
jgi:uncharacterized membrane protein YhfC